MCGLDRSCRCRGANAIVEKALEKTLAELGRRSTPADAIRAMAELALLTDPEGEALGRSRARSSPYTVVIHRRGGSDACGGGGEAWIDGKDGPAPVAPEVVEEAIRRGAHIIETQDLAPLGDCAAIPFGKRGSVPPFLLREGYVERTPRGRVATSKARKRIGDRYRKNRGQVPKGRCPGFCGTCPGFVERCPGFCGTCPGFRPAVSR